GARRRSTVRSGHRSRSLVTICDPFVDSDVYAPIHAARARFTIPKTREKGGVGSGTQDTRNHRSAVILVGGISVAAAVRASVTRGADSAVARCSGSSSPQLLAGSQRCITRILRSGCRWSNTIAFMAREDYRSASYEIWQAMAAGWDRERCWMWE